MAAVFAAREPDTGRLFVYRSYHAGGLSVPAHVRQIRHGEMGGLPYAVGGAPGEDAWRAEFRAAGLPTRRPAISDLSVQIDKVYGELSNGRLLIFDDLDELREELSTYSHKLNDRDEPQDEIEDEADYHLHAGLRYLVSDVCRGKRTATSGRLERRAVSSRWGQGASSRMAVPARERTDAEIEQMLDAAPSELR